MTNKAILLAGTMLALAATPAMARQTPAPAAAAQAPVPTGPVAQAPLVDAAQQGVLVFEPAFFADSQPNTALDMINRLPGFGLETGNNDTRGFAGAAGNVLIDGDRPSSKSDGLDEVLRRITADSVARVELIRGGAPGINMQGRSVVANVILKRTVQTERVVEVNAYVYPDGYVGPVLKAEYSRREGDNQIEGAISATTDRTDNTGDGYRRRFDANGTLIQDADLELYDRIRYLDARGAIQRRVEGGKLRVNGLVRYEPTIRQIDTDVFAGAGDDFFSSEDIEELSTELGANWSRPLSERTELELTGLQRWEKSEYISFGDSAGQTSELGAESTAGESIARAVLRFRQSDRWAFETGGEAAYNFLDSATTFAENGVAVPLPSASVKVEELRGEVFGQTTWRPSERLTVEAGLRVEVSEISQSGDSNLKKSFVYPKPRLQLTWTPVTGHQLRFRAEREVGQLDFGDFIASAEIDLGQVEGGNPDLEPSKSTVYEVVYERRFWDEGVFELKASHAEIEDIIDIIPLAGGFEAVGNIGEGTSDFLQALLTLPMDRLGLPNARLRTRVSWAESSLIDPLTGEERRFSGQSAYRCAVNYNQDLRGGRWSYGFDTGCNLNRSTGYRVREIRRNEGEPFVTLYGQWKPSPDMTVRVDLGNASDREQRRYRDVYSGPRDIAPLVYREERGTKMSPWLYIQIRKSL